MPKECHFGKCVDFKVFCLASLRFGIPPPRFPPFLTAYPTGGASTEMDVTVEDLPQNTVCPLLIFQCGAVYEHFFMHNFQCEQEMARENDFYGKSLISMQ